MPKQFASISVVVPGLNEEKDLTKCLTGLLNQEVKPKEVIFVNNNSTDNTLEIANSFKTKFDQQKIKYIVITQEKKGIAVTRNAGWRLASQPIIASTDSDCIPHKDWIKSIEIFFKENDIVAVAGKVIHYDSPPIWKKMTEFGGYSIIYKIIKLRYRFHPIATGNSAVKKTAYMEIGGFDQKITSINGLDDIELASRLSHIGKIKYNKRMTVETSFRRYQDLKKAVISFYERYLSLTAIRRNYTKKKREIFLTKIFKFIDNF